MALSSFNNLEIDTSVRDSGVTGGGGSVVPGGRVSSLGLFDRARLRGFVGDCGGGAKDSSGLGVTGVGGSAGAVTVTGVDAGAAALGGAVDTNSAAEL